MQNKTQRTLHREHSTGRITCRNCPKMEGEMLHISFGNGKTEVSVRLKECIPCTVGGNSAGSAADVHSSSESPAAHARNSEPINRGHNECTATDITGLTGIISRDECLDLNRRKRLDSNFLLASECAVEQAVNSKLRPQEVRDEPAISLQNTSASQNSPDAPASSSIATVNLNEVGRKHNKCFDAVSSPEKLPEGIAFEGGKFVVGKTYKGAHRDIGSFDGLNQAIVALGVVSSKLWQNGRERTIGTLTVDASFLAIKVLAETIAKDDVAVTAYAKGDQKLFNDRLRAKECLLETFAKWKKKPDIVTRKGKRSADLASRRASKKHMTDTNALVAYRPAVYSDCKSVIVKPGSLDVIFGHGSQGNHCYRDLISYHAADCDEKGITAAACTIVDIICCQGGHFLQELQGSQVGWEILSNSDAMQKTIDKLREKQMNGLLIRNGKALFSDCGSIVIKPGTFDILPGSSGASIKHQGNKYFRKLVSDRFIDCDENSKTTVARKILQNIRSRGGSFLKEVSCSQVGWLVLSEDEAIKKTETMLCSMKKMVKIRPASTSIEDLADSIEKDIDVEVVVEASKSNVDSKEMDSERKVESNEMDSEMDNQIELGPDDVFIACRGSPFFDHVGNTKFTQIVESCLDCYRVSGGPETAKYIIGIIHGRGGRFLDYVSDQEGKWMQMPSEKAIQKVIGALANQKKRKAEKQCPSSLEDKNKVPTSNVTRNHLPPLPTVSVQQPPPPPPIVFLPPLPPHQYLNSSQARPQHQDAASTVGSREENKEIALGPHDIVVAPEGSTLRNHIGNQKFKWLIESCLERSMKEGGQATAKDIVKLIHGHGGRFLQCDTDQGSKSKFVGVSDENAFRIVTCALDQVSMSLKISKDVLQRVPPRPPPPPPPPPPPHYYPDQYNYQAQQPSFYPTTYPYGYDPRYPGYYY